MKRRHNSRGSGLVETIIALPVLWIVLGSAVEIAGLFRTKAALNHATLQAARAGMVANGAPQALVNGLTRGLLPLYGPPAGLAGAAQTLAADVLPEVAQFGRIRILNPTSRAFDDFAVTVNGEREIPNDELYRRSTTVGTAGGVSIQDANLLKVEVVFGAELTVPLVKDLIIGTLRISAAEYDGFDRALLDAGRVPVLATATVRMQTPMRLNDFVIE